MQSIFDPAECKTAVTAQGVYRASINLFWADILVSPTPAVPMSITRTRAWGEQFFSKEPCHLQSSIVIAVPATDADVNATKRRPFTPSCCVLQTESSSRRQKTSSCQLRHSWRSSVAKMPCIGHRMRRGSRSLSLTTASNEQPGKCATRSWPSSIGRKQPQAQPSPTSSSKTSTKTGQMPLPRRLVRCCKHFPTLKSVLQRFSNQFQIHFSTCRDSK